MLLDRLIFHGFGLGRLMGGLGGALLGWFLLFGGVQFWLLLEHNLAQKNDLMSPQYFIIHKPVPLVNLFGPAGVAFTDAEINELKNQPFISGVAAFQCNRFKAHAVIGESTATSALATDLFFEAIPDEYLDVKAKGWRWKPGEEELPIVISRDYLALYNFGFAQSQNLPQINDQMLGQIRFQVRVVGRGKELVFKGRIAGFTERINSILVPHAFLSWANSTLGEGKDRPSRLMVKADAAGVHQLMAYFAAKSYQYNSDQLKTAKIGAALRFLFGVVSALGAAVLLLACWVFALSFQLLVTQNRESLRKLTWLGYQPIRLVHRYMVFVVGLVVVINLVSLPALYWGMDSIGKLIVNYGYALDETSLWWSALLMGCLSLLIVGANYWMLRRQVFQLEPRSR